MSTGSESHRRLDSNHDFIGILKEQEDWVLSELKKLDIENCEIETDGEWISIVVKE